MWMDIDRKERQAKKDVVSIIWRRKTLPIAKMIMIPEFQIFLIKSFKRGSIDIEIEYPRIQMSEYLLKQTMN